LTEEEVGALHRDMVRLDEPYWDVAKMRCDGAGTWTVGARVGGQWVGVASICRQQPPGSPVRGFFRIHGVAVRATDRGQGCATGLIERCLRHIASKGGRTVWCPVPLDTIHIWRRCGFVIAGPPAATRSANGGKRVWVLMMRRLALARAGLE
jgi:ribosomal protein S18 acetylase RimI-like enzyme